MFPNFNRQLWHQCEKGVLQLLAVEAVKEAMGHNVEITIACSYCGQRFAFHTCPLAQNNTLAPILRKPPVLPLLPFLKAVVSAECPVCRLAIDLSDIFASDTELTETERKVAQDFGNGMAVIGSVVLACAGVAWLAKRTTA